MASVGALALIASACGGRRSVPELLTFTEVVPSKVDYGERVDVMGVDLPASDVREAHVILRGDLFRPGRAPLRHQTIEIDQARVRTDRVSFELTDAVAERILGRGADAVHTTFRGTIEVSLPSTASNVPVMGTLRGQTVLDFSPRTPPKNVIDERAHEAEEARAFIGLELDESGEPIVTAVRSKSPAERAGIGVGDRIVAFEGVDVLGQLDIIPSGGERTLDVIVEHGATAGSTPAASAADAPRTRDTKTLDLEGWKSDTSRDLIAPVLVLASLIAVFLALGTRAAKVFTWLERRIERGTSRHRSESASMFARWSDFIRSVVLDRASSERDPKEGALAVAAPFIVFVAVSATFGVIPYVELHRRAEIDLGVLYLMSMASYVAMALVTGGHDAAKRWTILTSLKALGRALACEIPAALAIAAVIVQSGSLQMRDIAISQTGPGAGSIFETGAWPWYSLAVQRPQLFVMFALFFVTVVAEPSRALANADGSSTITTFRRTAFFFAEWANVFIMCAIAVALFLGGWYVPGFSPSEHESNGWIGALGTALFLAKSWALVAIVMTKRVSLPRLRADLVLRFALRVVLPISLLSVGLTVVQTLYPPMPTVALMIHGVTLGAVSIVVMLFAVRLMRRERSAATKTASTALI